MLPINEFFRNMPHKCCSSCGRVMIEQADCYTTTCTECEENTYYPIHLAI